MASASCEGERKRDSETREKERKKGRAEGRRGASWLELIGGWIRWLRQGGGALRDRSWLWEASAWSSMGNAMA